MAFSAAPLARLSGKGFRSPRRKWLRKQGPTSVPPANTGTGCRIATASYIQRSNSPERLKKVLMPQTQLNNGSPVGLDVGTSRIVTAHRVDDQFQYQTQLNAFVNLPYSKMTENVLSKERVPHSVQGSGIVVHGNESERFADLLSVETRRPMSRGVLNPEEPQSLTQIQKIIESLIGPARSKGQKLYFSIPAASPGADDSITYHEASLRQILTEFGYDVHSINEGLAVVYAELEKSNFTGIGISCGGGLCNVCLSYLSVPVLSFSVNKGGDFIDSSAAGATGDLINRIRITKEDTFHFNG